MEKWSPRKNERVFSTPRGVEGFNHLTRLEPVDKAGDFGYITVSNRRFKHDFTSTDDTSIEYGELELRQATPARLREWNQFIISSAKADSLILLEWPEFIGQMDDVDLSILHEAVCQIRSRHLPAEIAPQSVDDFQAIKWFYFKITPPLWCPPGTSYLALNVSDELFAVDREGRWKPIMGGPVEAGIKAGVIVETYEPDRELEYRN